MAFAQKKQIRLNREPVSYYEITFQTCTTLTEGISISLQY